MSERLRIYISGPISQGDLQFNIDHARTAGKRLIEAGFAPLVPQLSCFFESNDPSVKSGFPHETWLAVDLPWVAVADAVLRLLGPSVGADKETDLAKLLEIPIYHNVEELIANPPKKGDKRFHDLLRQMGKLHDAKQSDYGLSNDPFANVRASREWGIEPWLGALVRLHDKVQRLKTYAKTGKLSCEGAEDSMLDIAVYALIALILHREANPPAIK